MRIFITGRFTAPRCEVAIYLEARGHTVVRDRVNRRDVDMVLCGADPGSSVLVARVLGLPVVSDLAAVPCVR
jgi:hypothetical protein